jgi:hypothetical protein
VAARFVRHAAITVMSPEIRNEFTASARVRDQDRTCRCRRRTHSLPACSTRARDGRYRRGGDSQPDGKIKAVRLITSAASHARMIGPPSDGLPLGVRFTRWVRLEESVTRIIEHHPRSWDYE